MNREGQAKHFAAFMLLVPLLEDCAFVNASPQLQQVKRTAYMFYIMFGILEAILQCIYISRRSPKGIPWRTVFLKGYLVASVVGR